jgi:hypothetical protein
MLLDPAVAQETIQVELLLSDDSSYYQDLAGAFQTELSLACANRCQVTPSVRVSRVEDWQPATHRDLLVAVGNEAALHAVVSHTPKVLYGLIPQSTWQILDRLHPSDAGDASAVYLDQPIGRQFHLLAISLPTDRRRIGVLLGPESLQREDALREAAGRYGMSLEVRHVYSSDKVGAIMEGLTGEIDALLAMPDSVVFNRDTLYGILLTSYGAGIPVIGYSESLVNAGAMLALYTSVPDMARHLAQVSADFILKRGMLPEPGPSQNFEIAVNHNVARSLGFELPDAAELSKPLRSEGAGDDAAQAAQ